ncbi:MAG: type II toxin-antitoxin system Phd/YefM family antitoxin [Candidatus Saccharimonadales bacterium]
MDKVVTIYEAKTNLSKLVKQAQAGQTIYIGAYGHAQAILAPPPAKRPIKIGVWQGKHKITYSDGELINSDPEVVAQMLDGDLFPRQ